MWHWNFANVCTTNKKQRFPNESMPRPATASFAWNVPTRTCLAPQMEAHVSSSGVVPPYWFRAQIRARGRAQERYQHVPWCSYERVLKDEQYMHVCKWQYKPMCNLPEVRNRSSLKTNAGPARSTCVHILCTATNHNAVNHAYHHCYCHHHLYLNH